MLKEINDCTFLLTIYGAKTVAKWFKTNFIVNPDELMLLQRMSLNLIHKVIKVDRQRRRRVVSVNRSQVKSLKAAIRSLFCIAVA